MKNQMKKVAILTPGAAGVNVYDDAALNHCVICDDNTANPLVSLIPPIKGNVKNYVTTQNAVAEVAKVQRCNIDDDVLAESTRYKLILEQWETQYENTSTPVGTYAYTTPIATLGSAALDRANLCTILVDKINAHAINRVAAYVLQKIPYNTGAGATTPIVGDTVTQAVSGFVGTIVEVEITAGTFVGGNAVGFLWLRSTTGTFVITEVVTTAGSVVATLVPTAAGTPAQDIAVIDDGAYFRNSNKGKTTLIKADDFLNHTVTITRDGVYEIGNGTNMLADVPRFDESGQDMLSGSMEYYAEDLPVAGHLYSRVEVTCFRPGVLDPMTGNPGVEAETTMVIWLDEVGGLGGGNPHTLFLAALAAAIV